MIGRLTGKVIAKDPPGIILEVNSIGYEVLCPIPTFYNLQNNATTTLYTHLQIKQDSHTIYGFATTDDKKIFKELIKVNGVGPKVALAILSHLNSPSLINCIIAQDYISLTKTPGVGKKVATKIIIELKDRFEKMTFNNLNTSVNVNNKTGPNISQASDALQKLGFKIKEIEKMLATITNTSLSTEEIIRFALKNK